MEPRILLSVVSWVSDASGFWDVAANWEDDQGTSRVPGPGDDVVIDRPSANPTVTYRSGTTSIKSLTSQEPVTLSGGTLSVDSTLQGPGPYTLSGGTLSGTRVVSGTTLQVIGGDNVLAGFGWTATSTWPP
jgi:hypothetical protein